jgi:hypothetical protein
VSAAGSTGVDLPDQLLERVEAVLGPLRHRAADERVHPLRHLGPPGPHARHRVVDVLQGDRDHPVAVVGHLARQQLEEEDAERVLVGAVVGLLAGRLLRREVVARPHDRPGLRDPALLLEEPRDAEVGHLRGAELVEQDVLRLHVAVHDAVGVRVREAARRLADEPERILDRQRPAGRQVLLQVRPADELEDDVLAVLHLAAVDHRDEVRVRELRDRPRLAAEARDVLRVVRERLVQHLERDVALEDAVVRAVDARHAAATEGLLDRVATRDDVALLHEGSTSSTRRSPRAGASPWPRRTPLPTRRAPRRAARP